MLRMFVVTRKMIDRNVVFLQSVYDSTNGRGVKYILPYKLAAPNFPGRRKLAVGATSLLGDRPR